MSPPRVLVGLGEILWDVFPDGPRFGGAPANFACAAAQLGARRVRVMMASGVGDDELGQQALARLHERGVDTRCVARLPRPTGRVLVELDAAGGASYQFEPNAAWDCLPWSDALATLAERVDVVCFGTLAQRSAVSRATIRHFLRCVPADSLRVLDINLRSPFWNDEVLHESLRLANVLKLNETELPILASRLNRGGSELELLRALREEYRLRCIALTRGSAGACLLDASGAASDLPGQTVTVADTVGAGDAYTAALVLGLLADWPIHKINERASEIAAYVCTQPGATPELPAALRAPFAGS